MSARVDLAAVGPQVWKSRLGALRSHYIGDDDPRVREALAALSYHRLRASAEREVAAGHLDPAVTEILDRFNRYYSPEASGQAHDAGPDGDDDPPRGGSLGGRVSGGGAAMSRAFRVRRGTAPQPPPEPVDRPARVLPAGLSRFRVSPRDYEPPAPVDPWARSLRPNGTST